MERRSHGIDDILAVFFKEEMKEERKCTKKEESKEELKEKKYF